MWETSKGLEDGGGIKRLRNEDRSDEKRVSVTDAPLTEPTVLTGCIVPDREAGSRVVMWASSADKGHTRRAPRRLFKHTIT